MTGSLGGGSSPTVLSNPIPLQMMTTRRIARHWLWLWFAVTSAMSAQTLSIDLREALARARAYSPQFLAASTIAYLAQEDRTQAKSALFPSVGHASQFLYTQGNGTPSGVFVANNGVHVYTEQALVHADAYAPGKIAEYRRTQAAEAAARARRDVTLRGLSTVVVQNYYAVVSAQRRLENAKQSVTEAQRFLDITQKQEQGGEAAHTDVIRAQLQVQERQREQLEAENGIQHAKLNLGVMLFPDIGQAFDVVDDLRGDTPVPAGDQVASLAFRTSPDVRAATANVQQASYSVNVAKSAYLPLVTVDYFFGINANQFTVYNPDGQRNLGSSVQGTLTVPLWNWGITRSRVKQAELIKQQAETELTLTRRQVDADVRGFSLEAQTARTQLESLRTSMDLAAESVRLTLLRYQAGESTAFEVVDSQGTLATARNAYVDGLARYRLALANIQVLTGVL
jgi:outer membrane protein TolC